MDKRTHWNFSVRNFPQDDEMPNEPFEIDPIITKVIYEHPFMQNQRTILWNIERNSKKNAWLLR
jgi:hypothetical protein